MDSPIVTQLFRQLFRHRACQSAVSYRPSSVSTAAASVLVVDNGRRVQRRAVSDHRRRGGQPKQRTSIESSWQQRTDILRPDKSSEYDLYPMVTAEQLKTHKLRPRRVKMLTRDFIDDSLYNPNYGYFPKEVVIFRPGEPFDFPSLRDEPEFHRLLGQRYTEFEDKLDEQEYYDARQLWHTPTELFRPYYGEAIARYLIANYKLSLYPYHDLIIYEMGAGNGTLMLNILDYIRDCEPSVYDRTKFKVIEISPSLAELQKKQVHANEESRGHAAKIEIINKSIFDWDRLVPSPCYFLAQEVFDNFAHDSIRYDLETGRPMQGTVLIDEEGDFYDFYNPELDPLAERYLRVRHAATDDHYPHPLPERTRKVRNFLHRHIPLMPNLSKPEYIPTRLLEFFDILAKYFPGHRLVASDFHQLPDAVPGINAPVVQTRFERRMVPVTTPFVHQGYFDILFPTNFQVMENIYRSVTGKLTRVLSHEEFLKRWAFVEETETRSGENPMLSWYKNASVMTTVSA